MEKLEEAEWKATIKRLTIRAHLKDEEGSAESLGFGGVCRCGGAGREFE